ncbi:DUF4278 domain-containing protein [Nodosilinea sp. LEGE 07088]|uniref:DUF4278 domain-containing protein n=1 Tax=Nodosilinea sp. LEGE 07088 TaxID=2777968 RepID=UPI0018808DC0|nr:DUF4278 domain-containing protein [Nodosilinea sp. LEGE 07088]MBE9139980.1 DUF4278 domain-containing protein [Nodosilinea sp. LEGE 07088]
MKLSYRGAEYDVQQPQVQSDGVETIGTYRGAPLTRRHFRRQSAHSSAVQLTYRGVHYTQAV